MIGQECHLASFHLKPLLSEWYNRRDEVTGTWGDERISFVGQYFDADENRWMPLDYYPNSTSAENELNFPLRYQKAVYGDNGSVILFRPNEVRVSKTILSYM